MWKQKCKCTLGKKHPPLMALLKRGTICALGEIKAETMNYKHPLKEIRVRRLTPRHGVVGAPACPARTDCQQKPVPRKQIPFLLRHGLPALLRRKEQLFWYNMAPAKGNILCSDF